MLVARVSFFEVAVPVLLISITVLILVIAFRKLRTRWASDHPNSMKYAVLYSLEKQPISGEVEIYYEIEEPKDIEIWLMDAKMNDFLKLDSRKSKIGGTKIKFDSKSVENGRYFYELRSDNQKTSKAIYIEN